MSFLMLTNICEISYNTSHTLSQCDLLLQIISLLLYTVVYVLQYHTVKHTGGYVHEQEVVLQPVVLYQAQLTICSTDFLC